MKQGKATGFNLLVSTQTLSARSYLNGKGQHSCLLPIEKIVEAKVNAEMLDPETLLPLLGCISNLDWKGRLCDFIPADNNVFEPEYYQQLRAAPGHFGVLFPVSSPQFFHSKQTT